MNFSSIADFFTLFPTDWIIIFALAVFTAFDALRSGYGRACALALSLPAAFFLSSALEHARVLSGVAEQFSSPGLKSALFGIVFVAVYLLVRKMSAPCANRSGEIIQALMAGVAATAVLITVWLAVPELQAIWHFGAQVQAVFGEQYRFWWVASSYMVLAFVKG